MKKLLKYIILIACLLLSSTFNNVQAQWSKDYPTSGVLFSSQDASKTWYQCTKPEQGLINCDISKLIVIPNFENIEGDCHFGMTRTSMKFEKSIDKNSNDITWLKLPSKKTTACGLENLTRFEREVSKLDKGIRWKFIRENKINNPKEKLMHGDSIYADCKDLEEKVEYSRRANNVHNLNCQNVMF